MLITHPTSKYTKSYSLTSQAGISKNILKKRVFVSMAYRKSKYQRDF